MRLGERFVTMVTSRGCWHSSCLYCCIGAFHSKKHGEKFALRTPENVAEELAGLYRNRRVRLFQFHDDNFMLPTREATLERLERLKEAFQKKGVETRKIALLIKARPDTIDGKVAHALRELGAVGVFMGIENASETGLKALIRGASLRDVERALAALDENGMIATYNLLMFHPNATLDEINQNIEFASNHRRLPFDFGRAEVVAGSPLERMLAKGGGLKGTWPNWDYCIKDPAVERMFRINQMTFRKKSSRYGRLAEASIAMAYQAYTARRIHSGSASEEIAQEALDLIEDINTFVVGQVMEAYRLTVSDMTEPDVDRLFRSISEGSERRLKSTAAFTLIFFFPIILLSILALSIKLELGYGLLLATALAIVPCLALSYIAACVFDFVYTRVENKWLKAALVLIVLAVATVVSPGAAFFIFMFIISSTIVCDPVHEPPIICDPVHRPSSGASDWSLLASLPAFPQEAKNKYQECLKKVFK